MGKSQGNIQVPQPYIAVNAQNLFALLSQGTGQGGAHGSFARTALAGQNCKQFSQIHAPPAIFLLL
jgi:hypothetical protein